MSADRQEQEDELLALHSIFGSDEFLRDESKFGGELRVCVELPAAFTVALKEGETLSQYEISFLPPLLLTFELPEDYPSSSPPSFTLTCSWLTHSQGLLGLDCVQLPECGHIFCRACLSQFCKLQITEGSVQGVTCPEADCKAAPTPAQVRSLVGEELFSRYDRLLLQKTLDCMADVVYCPRQSCGSPVIWDRSGTAAMCTVCSFAFCVACKKTYHGTEDCQGKKILTENDAQQTSAGLPQSQEGLEALWDDYASGSKQRKQLLESRYGRKTMQLSVGECLSEQWVDINSKNCPCCFSRIQKDGGCIVMTCSRCMRMFCWSCLTKLSSHSGDGHFDDGRCDSYSYDF